MAAVGIEVIDLLAVGQRQLDALDVPNYTPSALPPHAGRGEICSTPAHLDGKMDA